LEQHPLEGADLELGVQQTDCDSDHEHKCAVEDVAEHDAELEGECDHVEESGVDFLLARDALGVRDDLHDFGGRVLAELGGRVEFALFLLGHVLREHLHLPLHEFVDEVDVALVLELNQLLEVLEEQLGHPALRDETGAADVLLVHGFEDALLLVEEGLVHEDGTAVHAEHLGALAQFNQNHVDRLVVEHAFLLEFLGLLLLHAHLLVFLLRNVEDLGLLE